MTLLGCVLGWLTGCGAYVGGYALVMRFRERRAARQLNETAELKQIDAVLDGTEDECALSAAIARADQEHRTRERALTGETERQEIERRTRELYTDNIFKGLE